jgi:hypothetical protein
LTACEQAGIDTVASLLPSDRTSGTRAGAMHSNERSSAIHQASLRRCSMLCEFARERQVGLFLRRLRYLLPLQESLPGEIFISARSMPKKLRQRFEVTILGNEAAFKVPLKHHADIEG